ncbi:T9SS type A sorting domain-containing protein [candidate division KSB1 bacterium]|nr:T9SS type A sorting domain-containing protein [candidate division KSB1 bacterium]
MDMVVPVSLAAFDVRLEERRARLTWTTASEDNNLGFDVQHKFSEDFENLGFVRGNGTTAVPQYYQFLTEKLAPGRHQFWLKQIDLDGSFTLSHELEVKVTIPGTFELSELFPNPFNPTTTIQYGLPTSEIVTLKISNLLGENVVTLVNNEFFSSGYHVSNWDGRNTNGREIASGIYVYQLQAGGFSITKKMLLIR